MAYKWGLLTSTNHVSKSWEPILQVYTQSKGRLPSQPQPKPRLRNSCSASRATSASARASPVKWKSNLGRLSEGQTPQKKTNNWKSPGVYDGLSWVMMIYDDSWWFMMVYCGLWWFIIIVYHDWWWSRMTFLAEFGGLPLDVVGFFGLVLEKPINPWVRFEGHESTWLVGRHTKLTCSFIEIPITHGKTFGTQPTTHQGTEDIQPKLNSFGLVLWKANWIDPSNRVKFGWLYPKKKRTAKTPAKRQKERLVF